MAVRGFIRSDRGKRSVMRVGAKYVGFTAQLPNGDTVDVTIWADHRIEVSGTTLGQGWKEETLFQRGK